MVELELEVSLKPKDLGRARGEKPDRQDQMRKNPTEESWIGWRLVKGGFDLVEIAARTVQGWYYWLVVVGIKAVRS